MSLPRPALAALLALAACSDAASAGPGAAGGASGQGGGGQGGGGAGMSGASGQSGAAGCDCGPHEACAQGACEPLGGGCGDAAGLDPQAPWPMARRCPTRTARGQSPGPRQPVLTWRAALGSAALLGASQPVVGAEQVYVTLCGGVLVSFGARDGVLRWTAPLGEPLPEGLACSDEPPLLDARGRVHALSPRGVLVSVDAATGAEAGRLDLSTEPGFVGGKALLPSGEKRIFMGNDGGILRELIVSADVPLVEGWSRLTGSPLGQMATSAGQLIAPTSDSLRAYAPDGTPRWAVGFPPSDAASVVGAVVGRGGVIYSFAPALVGSAPGAWNTLRAATPDGALRWTYAVSLRPTTQAALGLDGEIVFGTGGDLDHPSQLVAVSPGGAQLWALDRELVSAPVVDSDGVVYAVERSEQAPAHLLLARDGAELRSLDLVATLGRDVVGARSPALGGPGWLYLVVDGELVALRDEAP